MKAKIKARKGMKKLSPPIRKKVGNWVEQEFDASLERFGITWLRVKDGMGGGGKREDWVAEVPAVCISIHDYHWNGDKFGPDHGSFDGAIKAETREGLQEALDEIEKLEANLTRLHTTVGILTGSIAKMGRAK